MSTYELAEGEVDFPALVARAEPVDPRQPRQRLAVPREPRSFAFQLDNDLVKLVRVVPDGPTLRIAVIYATDTVLEQDQAAIRFDDGPEISADPLGLVVAWREPLLRRLGWFRIRRQRRF